MAPWADIIFENGSLGCAFHLWPWSTKQTFLGLSAGIRSLIITLSPGEASKIGVAGSPWTLELNTFDISGFSCNLLKNLSDL